MLGRKVRIFLLVIIAAIFLVGFVVGWLARSAILISDPLDMRADAVVRGLLPCALGGMFEKTNSARFGGMLRIALGHRMLLEMLRRIY